MTVTSFSIYPHYVVETDAHKVYGAHISTHFASNSTTTYVVKTGNSSYSYTVLTEPAHKYFEV